MILSILFVCSSCGQNTENLIPNLGFEIGNGESPEGWVKDIGINKSTTNWFMVNTESPRSYQIGIDTTESHSGKSSYIISRVWSYAGQTTGIELADPIPINPQKKYILSFWYKTKGIIEYPIPLIVEFTTHSDTLSIRTEKRIPNSENWEQHFLLVDNFPPSTKNLDISFYCWMRTQGSIWLDDIQFRKATENDVDMYEEWRRRPTPPLEKVTRPIKSTATGFYRVDKIDNRWWLIDPKGYPTWAMSIVGEVPELGSDNPVTQTEWFKKEYGTTPESVTQTMYGIYEDLGFNAFAGWTDEPFAKITEKRYKSGQSYLPMVKVLGLIGAGGTAVKAKDKNGNIPSQDKRWMVDPFNPKWRKMAREQAAEAISKYKNKPWFMGWFVDNEIFYDDLFVYIWAEYSSKEFIKTLKEKYKNIESLNQAWTSSFGEYKYHSFNDILIDKPEPIDWDDPLWDDFVSFERHMIGAYINFTYNLVKELDPNHIVISNRLHWRSMPNLYRTIDLWGKYDIVCMNFYPNNNIIGFDSGELEVMKSLHKGTGRPIIYGEFSIPALDSKLYEYGPDPYDRPLDWSWHQVMKTQKERAEAYERCIKQVASLDFMLGLSWFETIDPDSKVRRSNRGIMNSDYRLYDELTKTMKRVHEKIKNRMQLKGNGSH